MISLDSTPPTDDVRDGGDGGRAAAETAQSRVCSLGLCTHPGAGSPEGRVTLAFGKRRTATSDLPVWPVTGMSILQASTSRLRSSGFPGCGQVVPYGMSAAHVCL